MQLNIGKLDKVVRVAVGCVIIGVAAYYKSWWGLVGVIPVATALVGFCPLYTLFGLNTTPLGRAEAEQPDRK